MNAIIFARGNGIQWQIAECKEYAEKQGYTVKGVVVGKGRELPDIINGMGGNIDRVIVLNMARLTRNALECYDIQADLKLWHGAKIEVASGEHREEAFDRLMQNILMATKENETRKRIERALEEEY